MRKKGLTRRLMRRREVRIKPRLTTAFVSWLIPYIEQQSDDRQQNHGITEYRNPFF